MVVFRIFIKFPNQYMIHINNSPSTHSLQYPKATMTLILNTFVRLHKTNFLTLVSSVFGKTCVVYFP